VRVGNPRGGEEENRLQWTGGTERITARKRLHVKCDEVCHETGDPSIKSEGREGLKGNRNTPRRVAWKRGTKPFFVRKGGKQNKFERTPRRGEGGQTQKKEVAKKSSHPPARKITHLCQKRQKPRTKNKRKTVGKTGPADELKKPNSQGEKVISKEQARDRGGQPGRNGLHEQNTCVRGTGFAQNHRNSREDKTVEKEGHAQQGEEDGKASR